MYDHAVAPCHSPGERQDRNGTDRHREDDHQHQEDTHNDTATVDRDLQRLRHDLRQPLAAIAWSLEVFDGRPDVPVDLRHAIAQISRQAEWMQRVLTAALGDWTGVEVVDLADALVEPCSVAPANAAYEIRFDPRGRSPVLVDPIALERSARNLLDNAARAVSGGGVIDVSVTNRSGRAVLEVADSGPGFGRLAPQHGHGLVGVRRFAERFGGELVCGTSSLGGGLVELTLPIAVGW
jgi:signal transduction histidine kinase